MSALAGVLRVQAPADDIPLAYVDRFCGNRLRRVRVALEKVPLRFSTHSTWLDAWNAVNEGLSDLDQLLRDARVAGVMPGICRIKSGGMEADEIRVSRACQRRIRSFCFCASSTPTGRPGEQCGAGTESEDERA